MRVVHPCEDVDVREMAQTASAGFMQVGDVPDVESRSVHLAGITDQEFTLDLVWRLTHEPAESPKFAAALVSVKMESRGPFAGTLDDVLRRVRAADPDADRGRP